MNKEKSGLMDCIKVGNLISKLRKEKGLTQKDVADKLGIQSKTVSKWECGWGCPDASYWVELSDILGVNISNILEGQILSNKPDNGNIEKVKFYVCKDCGNILFATGPASIFCCGRKLESLEISDFEKPEINVSVCDTDNYITFEHPMEKEHYISFAAYVVSDKVLFNRLYPEQSPEIRIPTSLNRNGKLYLCCSNHGLVCYENILF